MKIFFLPCFYFTMIFYAYEAGQKNWRSMIVPIQMLLTKKQIEEEENLFHKCIYLLF